MNLQPIPLKTGYFNSFDNNPIYYEVRGQGAPIVLVYGIACLINHWHYQIDFLSKHFQVITFDLRGHHKSFSPQHKAKYSLECIAKDIPYLLRHLGLRKASFAGHSFGAQVLLKTYEMSPEIFDSIIFVNGFAKNPIKGMFGVDIIEPTFRVLKEQYQLAPDFINQIWKKLLDNPLTMIGLGLAGGFNLKHTDFKDIEIYTRGVGKLSLEVFFAYFEDMMTFDGIPVAQKIKVPSLILSGEKDLVTPLKFQYELHSAIEGSEFFKVPYGSHCTQLDFPDYINLKLESFLRSIAKPLS